MLVGVGGRLCFFFFFGGGEGGFILLWWCGSEIADWFGFLCLGNGLSNALSNDGACSTFWKILREAQELALRFVMN